MVAAEPPASALQEQSFARDAEDLGGLFNASVRLIERDFDHRLLQQLDGRGQRLVNAYAHFGIQGGRRGDGTARRLDL